MQMNNITKANINISEGIDLIALYGEMKLKTKNKQIKVMCHFVVLSVVLFCVSFVRCALFIVCQCVQNFNGCFVICDFFMLTLIHGCS